MLINSVLNLNKSSINRKIEAACRYLNFEESFESFCGEIENLNSKLNIPKNMRAMGIKIDNLSNIVERALIDPSASTNPIKLNRDNLKETLLKVI